MVVSPAAPHTCAFAYCCFAARDLIAWRRGSLLVGAAATVGVAAVQERSIGDAVDDFTIRAQLNQIFFEENIDLFQSVSFNVVEGRVLLKGSVKKQESRLRALELVWQASGVREVVNEIQVTDQGGIVNYARDTWISTQLTAEMLLDIDIFDINYNIETINGVIYVVSIAQKPGGTRQSYPTCAADKTHQKGGEPCDAEG